MEKRLHNDGISEDVDLMQKEFLQTISVYMDYCKKQKISFEICSAISMTALFEAMNDHLLATAESHKREGGDRELKKWISFNAKLENKYIEKMASMREKYGD